MSQGFSLSSSTQPRSSDCCSIAVSASSEERLKLREMSLCVSDHAFKNTLLNYVNFFCSNARVSSHCFVKYSSRRSGFWMSLQAVVGMANIVLTAKLPALFIEEHRDPQSSSLSRNMWRSFFWWHHPAQSQAGAGSHLAQKCRTISSPWPSFLSRNRNPAAFHHTLSHVMPEITPMPVAQVSSHQHCS